MKKSKSLSTAVFLIILISVGCSGNMSDEKSSSKIISILQQGFDHAGERSPEIQYYSIETKLVHFALAFI